MPGFDKSGPMGKGSMTGWRRGPCVTEKVQAPENENPLPEGAAFATDSQNVVYGLGRGGVPCGCGRGFGGGRNRGFVQAGRGFNGGGCRRGRRF